MKTVRPKNIALFIDGTWNKASAKNLTNVRKLFDSAYAFSGPEQVVHYIAGVGTDEEYYSHLPFWVRNAGIPRQSGGMFAGFIRKCAGGLFGYGMPAKVMEAYAFLVAHYNPGDRIFIFGFSRGAYAVRSLTCFIEEVGLLLKSHLNEVGKAYRLFQSGDQDGIKALSKHLKKLTGFSSAGNEGKYVLPVHMMGVWDTVGALKFTEHHRCFRADNTVIEVPGNISHVRHALALHELRPQFEPMFWKQNNMALKPSLQQVWFAGAHANVGGGYPETELSNIALEWMACEARNLGLAANAVSDVRAERSVPVSINNSVSGVFLVVSPTIRAFLEEGNSDFFAKDLDGYSVHHSAAVRVRGDMPKYEFADYEVNRLQRKVDDDTLNLIWALALKMGQLPLETGSAGLQQRPGRDTAPSVQIDPRFRKFSDSGVTPAGAAATVAKNMVDGSVGTGRFAVSLLVHMILHRDLELTFLQEQLRVHELRHSELETLPACEISGEKMRARVRSVSRGMTVASRLASNLEVRYKLLSLAACHEIRHALHPKASCTARRRIPKA